jgi:sodium/bile acid cotransporter 7
MPAGLFRDPFLWGLLIAVAIATVATDLGRSGGILGLDRLINVGIATVFFLHGMAIPRQQLITGMTRWRLHVLVQSCTFILFPLLGLVLWFSLQGLLPPHLILGFFFLCALPSTISSSVAMTAIARGNVPAAVFNATLSSLIGILLTPLLISLVASTSGITLSFSAAVIDISRLLLLPFLLGQLLSPWLGRWFAQLKPITSKLDKGVIIMLVLITFSDAVASGLWSEYGIDLLLITAALCLVLMAIVFSLSGFLARQFGFAREDEVVAVFCGSKKTLASGVPMATVLFGAHPSLGLIVLPILFYHQLQLILAAILAERYAQRS